MQPSTHLFTSVRGGRGGVGVEAEAGSAFFPLTLLLLSPLHTLHHTGHHHLFPFPSTRPMCKPSLHVIFPGLVKAASETLSPPPPHSPLAPRGEARGEENSLKVAVFKCTGNRGQYLSSLPLERLLFTYSSHGVEAASENSLPSPPLYRQ